MSVSYMLKGLLKMSMLKIISENKTTGYEIIKKVTDLTGEKPSTGSIYPLLKSMETKGWITGTTRKRQNHLRNHHLRQSSCAGSMVQ